MDIVNEGMAVCIFEPRGDCGLEGYSYGLAYRFQRMKSERGAEYYRMYPSQDSDYYETCGVYKFSRFFKEVT